MVHFWGSYLEEPLGKQQAVPFCKWALGNLPESLSVSPRIVVGSMAVGVNVCEVRSLGSNGLSECERAFGASVHGFGFKVLVRLRVHATVSHP